MNDTLKRATPIIMGGLAVCIAWRSGYEAMGGEGQMILGAFCSALVAYYLPLPGFVRLLLAMLAAVVVGAAYSALSAWLYDKFEVTFIISTLMLNYIANYFASYMTNFVVKDPEGAGHQRRTDRQNRRGGAAERDHARLGALGLRAGAGGGADRVLRVQEDDLWLQVPHGRPEREVRALRRHQRPPDALQH